MYDDAVEDGSILARNSLFTLVLKSRSYERQSMRIFAQRILRSASVWTDYNRMISSSALCRGYGIRLSIHHSPGNHIVPAVPNQVATNTMSMYGTRFMGYFCLGKGIKNIILPNLLLFLLPGLGWSGSDGRKPSHRQVDPREV